ncbi:hypothetical protein K443DRAFT_102460 [Laccaria amethystina LaAM-08-1]|uniref:Uncharacterized protein n=1 Tax=Laccaria amethystina LaAM-08-1 TaxID=1095629 RepID=A0A0C9WNQ7_9AGAR|nr:hypothetical protein K443DRAFT_102460 [Laccaria amethystina LaAM-08-1]
MIHECWYIDTKCNCLANVILKCQNSVTHIYQPQQQKKVTNQMEAKSRRARSKGQFPQPGEGVW